MYKTVEYDKNGCNGKIKYSTTSLYKACNLITGKEESIVIEYQSAKKGQPIIAFWDAHTKKVRPGAGASDMQKQAIINFRL